MSSHFRPVMLEGRGSRMPRGGAVASGRGAKGDHRSDGGVPGRKGRYDRRRKGQCSMAQGEVGAWILRRRSYDASAASWTGRPWALL
jgi:hypothetical protein